jgi:hypothetical protein
MMSLYGIIYESHAEGDTLSLCFISDTQEPIIFERLYLPYNNNLLARKLIFNSIRQTSPNSVFHLGDLVSFGFLPIEWNDIDTIINQLTLRKINFYPIPGNHEYLIFSNWGISSFRKRFPSIDIYGYSKQFGNTAVVLFNSNFIQLSDEEKKKELNWYENTLKRYEADSLIDFVIVGCHHAPFTNSKVVFPSAGDSMMTHFLKAFYTSSKCKLFLSGHAHTYEHFFINNKDFLVIGGGGGPLHPLYSGKEARYNDLFKSKDQKRMFHYITLNVYKKSLWVYLHMFTENLQEIKTIRQLNIK